MAVAIRGTTPEVLITVSDPISVTLTGARQPQSGDVLVIIYCNDFYALSNMPTPTVAGSTSGVNAVTNGTADGGTNGAHAKSFTYVVGSTGDLTVAADETGTADEEKGFVIYVLSGVDTASPVDVAGNAINTGGTTHICPSISPTSSDAYLICHTNTGGGAAAASYTHPSGMTETVDTVSGGMSMGGAILQLAVSGATGTKTFVPNTSVTVQGHLSIAIKSASVAESSAYSIARLPGRIGPDGKVFTPGRRFDDAATAAPAVTNAPAGDPAATGSAPQPAVALGINAGAAAGTGSAAQPTTALGAAAGVASGTGSALQSTVAIRANAGAASSTGTASQPIAAIRVNAGIAEATGSAQQPSVVTSGNTNAPAGLAAATGTAFAPTIAVRPSAGLAAGTGASNQPAASLGVRAGSAAGTGTAGQATVSSGANAPAGLAAATGTANRPTIVIRVNADVAAAVGTASGVAGPVQPVTPDSRILVIPADPRVLLIADTRILTIPADPRSLLVDADVRTQVIPGDPRTLTVPSS